MINKEEIRNELINSDFIYEDTIYRYPKLYTMNDANYYFHAGGTCVVPIEKYKALENLYLQLKKTLEGILKDEN